MEYKCPKCNFQSSESTLECLNCGIIFEKYLKIQQQPKSQRKITSSPQDYRPKRFRFNIAEYILGSILGIILLASIVVILLEITTGDIIVFLMGLALFSSIPIFFLPSIVSIIRSHPHQLPIFLLNIFLGLTMIGWVIALIWSAMPIQKTDS